MRAMGGPHLCLGELLMDAGIVSDGEIIDAVFNAQKHGLPVGRALVMTGKLSEPVLDAAIQTQSMFRDGLINRLESVELLGLIRREGVDLDQALAAVKTSHKPSGKTNRLGDLLLDADVFSEEELNTHLANSKMSGLQFGRYLVSTGLLPEPFITTALNIQTLIRDTKLERHEGIERLREKAAQLKTASYAKAQAKSSEPSSVSIRLGELLVNANVISQDDLMRTVEKSVLQRTQLGELLVSEGLILRDDLAVALVLQGMVAEGTIKAKPAAQALSLVYSRKLSLSEAIVAANASTKRGGSSIRLDTFLGLAGFISTKQLDEWGHPESVTQLAAKLLEFHVVSEAFLKDCQRIHTLLVEGLITIDRAIVVLRSCHKSGKPAKATLQDLGWQLAL